MVQVLRFSAGGNELHLALGHSYGDKMTEVCLDNWHGTNLQLVDSFTCVVSTDLLELSFLEQLMFASFSLSIK